MKEFTFVILALVSSAYTEGKNIVVSSLNKAKSEIIVVLNKSFLPQGKMELFRIDKYAVFIEAKVGSQEEIKETKEKENKQ